MATTRDEVLVAVRKGYGIARKVAEQAGAMGSDEDAAGPPAVMFATMADAMRRAAGKLTGDGPDNIRHDADALEMLAGLCRRESLTWAEVRS